MTSPAIAPTAAMSGRSRWTVVAVCCSALFLVGLDTTIVNVALPTLGDDFSVGAADLAWTVDAYTLVLASLLITSGALADRFGRRRVFQIGLTIFGLASIACALAPNVESLIAFRALQGVGGSMLSPVALAIVVNVMPDQRQRAQALGVWAATFGLSMAAGPLVGGALLEALSWRAVFWVSVPIILAVLALTAHFVPESKAPVARRFDPLGQLLLTGVIAGVVALLIEAPRTGWDHPAVIGGIAAVVVAFAGFIVTELRVIEPLMELRQFRNPPFGAAVVGAVAVFVALNATLLLATLYLQQSRGLSPVQAGLVILPLAAAVTVFSPVSGWLVGNPGPRLPLLLAGLLLAVGALCLFGLRPDTPLGLIITAHVLIGAGVGFANTPITNTAVSGLPPERAGVAGAITSTARQVGTALGVALAGGFLTGVSGADLAEATHVGWILVLVCGAIVVGAAWFSPVRTPAPVA